MAIGALIDNTSACRALMDNTSACRNDRSRLKIKEVSRELQTNLKKKDSNILLPRMVSCSAIFIG
jgi:hypothetical protein